ncbi:MAG TPA: hypothetical protein VEA59_02685 [Patescibacteria group bacterium]|nr:hypothetical protein [Patescibacteria group bacterium]
MRSRSLSELNPTGVLVTSVCVGLIVTLVALSRTGSPNPFGLLVPNDMWLVTILGWTVFLKSVVEGLLGDHPYGKVASGLVIVTLFSLFAATVGHVAVVYDLASIAVLGGLNAGYNFYSQAR